jgi:hypothetical protein
MGRSRLKSGDGPPFRAAAFAATLAGPRSGAKRGCLERLRPAADSSVAPGAPLRPWPPSCLLTSRSRQRAAKEPDSTPRPFGHLRSSSRRDESAGWYAVRRVWPAWICSSQRRVEGGRLPPLSRDGQTQESPEVMPGANHPRRGAPPVDRGGRYPRAWARGPWRRERLTPRDGFRSLSSVAVA